MRSRPMAMALIFPMFFVACAPSYELPTDVPAEIEVSADATLVYVAEAEGYQIYDCRADETGFTWVFRAPDATLYAACADDDARCDPEEVVGTHYAGPTWESNSGGIVVGLLDAKVASPDAEAIDWLRVTAVLNTGEGPFEAVTTLQRLNTWGGKAPATGCDESTVDTAHESPYTATYYFYE